MPTDKFTLYGNGFLNYGKKPQESSSPEVSKLRNVVQQNVDSYFLKTKQPQPPAVKRVWKMGVSNKIKQVSFPRHFSQLLEWSWSTLSHYRSQH